MREIKISTITEKICEMLIEACESIPCNVLKQLQNSLEKEESFLGKQIIQKIIENDELACKNHLPMCQDTGVVVCMLKIGYEVHFDGDIYQAINEGVARAYCDGYLRKSVVKHPLNRINTQDNTPAIVHIELVEGDKVEIEVAPKGGGSENMSLVKMLIPSDGVEGVKKLIINTVKEAGGKPCPPIIVGVGLGGNLEQSALLAKKALFRDIDDKSSDPILASLEKELLDDINKLGIGPAGLGGSQTCLAVKINAYPCHIASLPVAINIQCHAARHKKVII